MKLKEFGPRGRASLALPLRSATVYVIYTNRVVNDDFKYVVFQCVVLDKFTFVISY